MFLVCTCVTLLVVEVLYRLSCDLLLVREDLQLRSLCLCLHSRQFLTATQHTEGKAGHARWVKRGRASADVCCIPLLGATDSRYRYVYLSYNLTSINLVTHTETQALPH